MPRTSNFGYRSYSPELYSIVRKALHRIGELDYQNDVELRRIDGVVSDEDLKNYIKQKIQAAHQRKRQPYIDLLTTLRSEQQP
jgi:hypothetical protein